MGGDFCSGMTSGGRRGYGRRYDPAVAAVPVKVGDVNSVLIGFLGSLCAGLMTTLGALPALFGRKVSPKRTAMMLGFAAGVMLAASFLSLLVPGIAVAEELYGSRVIAAAIGTLGMVIGALAMVMLNEWVPHEHFRMGRQGRPSPEVARIWLFVLAITIHNAPEGLAVGVGFGGGDFAAGLTLAIGIGLQNLPEGLAVAVALIGIGYSRAQAFGVASLTGLVEPVTGLIGAYAVSLSQATLPWTLPFAAGAMLYVISHEIVPETHRHGFAKQATLGLIAGLGVMVFLDAAFG